MFNSVHPCTLLNDEICAMHKSRCCLCTQAILGWFLLCKNIAGLTRRSAGEKPYRVFRMKNSKVINVQGCKLMTRHPCRQGRRVDKATTSFHEVISCSTGQKLTSVSISDLRVCKLTVQYA